MEIFWKYSGNKTSILCKKFSFSGELSFEFRPKEYSEWQSFRWSPTGSIRTPGHFSATVSPTNTEKFLRFDGQSEFNKDLKNNEIPPFQLFRSFGKPQSHYTLSVRNVWLCELLLQSIVVYVPKKKAWKERERGSVSLKYIMKTEF